CGTGKMSEALKVAGVASVYASDIQDYGHTNAIIDFSAGQRPNVVDFDAFITNPPFGLRGKRAEKFIDVRLELGLALLLPVDFDSSEDARAPLRRLSTLCRQDRSAEAHRLVREPRQGAGESEGKHQL